MGYYVDVNLKFIFKEKTQQSTVEKLKEWGIPVEKKVVFESSWGGNDVEKYFVDHTPDNPKWWYYIHDFINDFAPFIESKVLGTYKTEDQLDGYTYIINPYRDEDIIKECHDLRCLEKRQLISKSR